MTFAYVQNNEVQKISSADTVEWGDVTISSVRLLTPAERQERGIYDFIPAGQIPKFHRGGAMTYQIDQVAGTVTEVVEAIPMELADVKEARKADLAAHRYQIETGGLTINGAQILTDRESQATLTGAWVTVQINPAALIDWKGVNGWTQIDKATVELLAGVVGTHVQHCFSAEKLHSDAIDALATVEAIAAYDISTGWPE